MDRNAYGRINDISRLMSLSARRAWIEIQVTAYCAYLPMVALRKESVDRNGGCGRLFWCKKDVALRKESVDRNV